MLDVLVGRPVPNVSMRLPRPATNLWAVTDLFVPEAIRRTIEPVDVETLRPGASGAAGNDDSIALFQSFAGYADPGKLRAIVHLEPPLFAAVMLDFQGHEGMWIDEVKLRDDTFDGYLSAAVVNARNRMMCVSHRD